MILQSLVDYYEYLAREYPSKIARLGWCSRQVHYMLELNLEGELIAIIPAAEKRGWTRMVPEQVKRTVGISPNLLCDNASYLLGIDAKRKPERACQCFDDAKRRHLDFLEGIDSPSARAVKKFFETWDPLVAGENSCVVAAGEELLQGANLIFYVNRQEVLNDTAVSIAWDDRYQRSSDDAATMTCLVSGERAPIARLHPSIKGVQGSQAMGASLVGFNARAFESYGHDEEQGLNAPVSEYATFAYSTALNYLLADRSHHVRLGDTTVVYWSSKSDEACTKVMGAFFDARASQSNDDVSVVDSDQLIHDVMASLERGLPIAGIDYDTDFFVLGIAPNAARLSVRFFMRNTFGEMLENVRKHYERLDIAHAPYEKEFLTPYQILAETENPNAKQPAATSTLGGALMRSILGNLPYPTALYANTLLRIRATQDNDDQHVRKVTRGRAAIVKAYLLKNREESEEDVTAYVNEERKDTPYILGRLFSVSEAIQDSASPGMNSTLKDKYYNMACATPYKAFGIIDRITNYHLRKLARDNKGLAVHYEKQRGQLIGKIQDLPKSFSSYEEGIFILGYFHQTQKRYEKKEQSNSLEQEA